MKKDNEIEVTFGGVNETPEVEVAEVVETIEVEVLESAGEVVIEPVEDVETLEVEEAEDAYAVAVDRLFESYQAFQQGFHSLPAMAKNPALMQMKLTSLMNEFQKEIQLFRDGNYQVDALYEDGHGYILQALDKYDEFLVEYPKALTGKKKMKSMKKIKDLGALSGRADQDMKAAFRSFEQAIQGGE